MMESKIVGRHHLKLLTTLRDGWLKDGPPVTWIEGFPGVGKTEIGHAVMETDRPAIIVPVPESRTDLADDLASDLAHELHLVGKRELAKELASSADRLQALSWIFTHPVLVIWDEAQRLLDREGRPRSLFGLFLERLTSRRGQPGRLLLLSNRRVDEGSVEHQGHHRLAGLESEDADTFLLERLGRRGRTADLDPDQRRQAVRSLGGNPRALRILVSALAYEPYSVLVPAESLGSGHLGPELVERLERNFLKRLLTRLDEPELHHLREALRRIPLGRFGRPWLAESLVLTCLAAEDRKTLTDLIEATGEEQLGEPQKALARVSLLTLDGRWREAAKAAAAGRISQPRYLLLAVHEAFCWLCAEEIEEAENALGRFPYEIPLKPWVTSTWLVAWLSFRTGDSPRAREALAAYLDRPLTREEQPSLSWLIRLWDEPAQGLMERRPCHDFPTLPPSLTGLSAPIHRETQYIPRVLDGLS